MDIACTRLGAAMNDMLQTVEMLDERLQPLLGNIRDLNHIHAYGGRGKLKLTNINPNDSEEYGREPVPPLIAELHKCQRIVESTTIRMHKILSRLAI